MRPEQVRVLEIGGVAEQVGDDCAFKTLQLKQGHIGFNPRSSCQPCFELFALGRVIIRVVDFEPCLLLVGCGKGQRLQRMPLNIFGLKECQQFRQEISESQNAFHVQFLDAECLRNGGGVLAAISKPLIGGEAFKLGRGKPRDIFQKRGFAGRFGVAALHNQAGCGLRLACFFGLLFERK